MLSTIKLKVIYVNMLTSSCKKHSGKVNLKSGKTKTPLLLGVAKRGGARSSTITVKLSVCGLHAGV